MFYFLFFYARILFFQPKHPSLFIETGRPQDIQDQPVSVVVCAHNEFENLKALIPRIMQQHYKTFELVVADDRSTDGSFDYFSKEYKNDPRFKILRVEENDKGENHKKHALAKAIETCRYELLLLTDADGVPNSDHWIANMAASLGEGKDIVLGYSPYAQRKGFLNYLIQFETLYTAVHYFSFALAGLPYMGVGRNLLYKKALFERNKGFKSHNTTIGGDDDLFIREVATKENVAICWNKESQIISIPKERYISWFYQKRRHLSVGTKYKIKHQILLGIQILSNLLFYFSLGVLICNQNLLFFPLLILRSLVFMVFFVLIARKLGHNFREWWLLLILDIVYIFNNMAITLSLLIDKKIKWS